MPKLYTAVARACRLWTLFLLPSDSSVFPQSKEQSSEDCEKMRLECAYPDEFSATKWRMSAEPRSGDEVVLRKQLQR